MANSTDKDKKVLLIIVIGVIAFIVLALVLSLAFLGVPGLGKQLAVIPVKGTITMEGDDFSGSFGALELVEKIEEAENDPSVAAIFFDIDSPGGEIVATHQVVEKIRETKKPSIAYIGSVGASGGYYIAAATDHVIADPFSVTGSIGAIWMIPNIKELLDDFGVTFNVVRSGDLKALPNPFEEMTAEQKALLEQMVKESFEQFKSDIELFRKDKIVEPEFETITDGRIISGKQALELNLVDELLTRDKAILRAGEIAGIKGKPVLKEFNQKNVSFFDLLTASGKAFASGFKNSFEVSAVAPITT